MAVRNLAELGKNLQRIIKRLMANDKLVNLLYYTDPTPLNQPILTNEDKKVKIYNKLIKIVPRVGPKETAHSMVSLRVVRGLQNPQNTEFRDIEIGIEVFVPITQWLIEDDNLRPFAILGAIQESLNGKVIDGLGKMVGGDFSINFITEEMSCYEQTFYLTSYD